MFFSISFLIFINGTPFIHADHIFAILGFIHESSLRQTDERKSMCTEWQTIIQTKGWTNKPNKQNFCSLMGILAQPSIEMRRNLLVHVSEMKCVMHHLRTH